MWPFTLNHIFITEGLTKIQLTRQTSLIYGSTNFKFKVQEVLHNGTLLISLRLWTIQIYLPYFLSWCILQLPRVGLVSPISEVTTQRFQTQHFPIRAVCLPLDFKSPVLFFWYELDPKLKLFWKGNAMKFKIGGVNVEILRFLCVIGQLWSHFWGGKKLVGIWSWGVNKRP